MQSTSSIILPNTDALIPSGSNDKPSVVGDFSNEKWAFVKGYFFTYMVSTCGRVKNKWGHIMCLNQTRNGYLNIGLCMCGSVKHFRVHRLVAFAFIPNSENKPYVNHLDGDPENNNDWNLEWSTQKENIQHAVKTGLIKTGEESHAAKLKNKEILEIFHSTDPNKIIAAKYDICASYVRSIKSGAQASNITRKVYQNSHHLTPSMVLEIFADKNRNCVIARKFNIAPELVSAIKNGSLWSSTTGKIYTPAKQKILPVLLIDGLRKTLYKSLYECCKQNGFNGTAVRKSIRKNRLYKKRFKILITDKIE